jgi:hypothetical protein
MVTRTQNLGWWFFVEKNALPLGQQRKFLRSAKHNQRIICAPKEIKFDGVCFFN